ncbi:MAG: DUF3488 domain-containing transglutaminase family protein [Nitrosomonadales bacterium]|nr:DUF3488 domain-containing transglutaminase family protein [Nitrosomonadales bacterium]
MNLPSTLIYGLLLCVLMVCAPHAAHLPSWVSVESAALLGWCAYLTRNKLALPARWLLGALMLGDVIGILASFHTLFGRDASTTLLILLTAFKQLEVRNLRDATMTIYLACFIIVTNFFYTQTIAAALYMLATLLLIVTVWLHLHGDTLPLKARLRLAAIMLMQAVPLMLVLFILFPRVQGPLWGLPQDAYGSSGLSDTMSPGSLSKLSLSDAVAFRVTFNGEPPRHTQMYWRGPVLWKFDGKTWQAGRATSAQAPQLDSLDSASDYTVTLEPHNKTWLFTLDMPTSISIPAQLTYDFQMVRTAPVNARLRYNAHSQLGYRANADEDPRQLQRALNLPPNLNPRARQLAAEWRARLPGDVAVVNAALEHFRREDFHYTLEPPALGSNEVDDFLFGTRHGFCEHYASSFVFLMRAAGIPARVVTGYQGGEYNDLGGYYIVRQSDAHAWAEVWLKERGWVRIDPTAAIAPARVQSGLVAAMPDSAALPFLARMQSPLLLKLRFDLDALAFQWNQWVLSYDPERQFALLTRLGMESVSLQQMALDMMLGLALLVGLYTLFMLRRLQVRDSDAVQRLYLRFCRKLEKTGIARAAHEGPRDFAMRAAQAQPQQAAAITDITARYMALRYGKAPDPMALQVLRRMVAAFRL